MRIIDFHTHAFPSAIAERAIPALEQEGNVKAVLDGKLTSLLASMDRAGIHASVVASIATKPEQHASILRWSQAIASERILPFPSVHPRDPEAADHVRAIHACGLRGIKLHPYYQDFDLDDPRLDPIYAALQETGLVLLCHTGFDLAFPRTRRCDPVRIRRVIDRFPRLRFVATHLGAWEDYDEVEKHLIGRPIYLDVAYAIDWAGRDRAIRMLHRHPVDFVLFGSDSPWADQADTLAQVRALQLGADREASLLGGNAARLLHLTFPGDGLCLPAKPGSRGLNQQPGVPTITEIQLQSMTPETKTISVGAEVPDFEMETYNPSSREFGKVSLSQLRGENKWTILVFYPADFTFVCPTELADLADQYEILKKLGAEVLAVSTDTKFSHLAWKDTEKLLAGVKYPMAADTTGAVSRLFGVYDAGTGLALRGTFIINPSGVLVCSEVNFYNVGRNADELVRKMEANVHLAAHPDEACPAKWHPGSKTLKPSEKLVGKVYEALR